MLPSTPQSHIVLKVDSLALDRLGGVDSVRRHCVEHFLHHVKYGRHKSQWELLHIGDGSGPWIAQGKLNYVRVNLLSLNHHPIAVSHMTD